MAEFRILTEQDLRQLVTPEADDTSGHVLDLGPVELACREIGPDARAGLVARIEAAADSGNLRRVGANDSTVWDAGWGEIADSLGAGSIGIQDLCPQYFQNERHFRLHGQFVEGRSPEVEFWLGVAIRRLIFARYLKPASQVIEIGCGTGLNMLLLAQARPDLSLIGCDWAKPSQAILAKIGGQYGDRVQGQWINMLDASGWDGAGAEPGAAVLTVHAMEQLADQWRPCLDFFCSLNPGLVLHVEPLVELYDLDDADDARMARYHRQRNYLHGYLPEIQAMAAAGRAEIVDLRRIPFSGLYHEAYSVLAWRPLA